jgi:outer membrane lipoprotein
MAIEVFSKKWIPWIGLILLLSGCAHTISEPLRKMARRDLSFHQLKQDPDAYVGEVVILGGIILDVENMGPSKARLEVLETPLEYREFPKDEVYSRGRFIAYVPKFLDPEVFKKGRKITLAGEVTGKETRLFDNVEVVCPAILVKELHLWRRELRAYPPIGYWNLYWYGSHWWWGWGWSYHHWW